jgi:hypothetical protein
MRGEEIRGSDESADHVICAVCKETGAVRRPEKILDYIITKISFISYKEGEVA